MLTAGLEWFCENCGRVMVIEYHDILVALAGCHGKTPGLVAVDFASQLHSFGKHAMGSDVGLFEKGWQRRHGRCLGRSGGERGNLGGADIFSVLPKMSFGGGDQFW